MFSFVLAYLNISKTTHKSKKMRQFIMRCFLDNEKDNTISVFTLTG